MLYASRDRSMSMRRWLPQNLFVRDGAREGAVGENVPEGRFCCGGAPARRGGFGHGRADRAVTEIMIHGLVVGGHLGPQEAGQFSGHGGGHDSFDVLASGQGPEAF